MTGRNRGCTRTAAFAMAVAVTGQTAALAQEGAAIAFDGAYGGLNITALKGGLSDGIDSIDFGRGLIGGGFLGYNHQAGDVVIGGEVVVNTGKARVYGEGVNITYVADLRARIGRVVGDHFVYLSGGVSALQTSGAIRGKRVPLANVGAGIETPLGEALFFGADYTHRTTDVRVFGAPITVGYHNIGARIGYRF